MLIPRSPKHTTCSGLRQAGCRTRVCVPQPQPLRRGNQPRWIRTSGVDLRRTAERNPTQVPFMNPCSNCHKRPPGKLATAMWRWFETEDRSVGYRCRFCVLCLTELMGSLKAGVSADSSLFSVCPRCGRDSGENQSPIWLWLYVPKQQSREYALTTCTSCAESLREFVQACGEMLPERGVGAAAPTSTPESEWSAVPW